MMHTRRGSCRAIAISMALMVSCALHAEQTFEEWLREDQQAFAQYQAEVTAQYERFLKEEAEAYAVFLREAGRVWGQENVWAPGIKRWVQYTEDFEERSTVEFENGVAEVEVVIEPGATDEAVRDVLADAIENLVLSGTLDPIEMIRRRLFPDSVRQAGDPDPGPARALDRRRRAPESESPPEPGGHATPRRYTVAGGDTLWGLSKRFGIPRQQLAEANGISPDGWLKIGQVLVIPGPEGALPPPPSTTTHARPRRTAAVKAPLLDRQVAMRDGTPVTPANARDFADEQAHSGDIRRKTVQGSDGVTREGVTVAFPLVPDHLRIRAERFRPAVAKYSALHGVYAPLVFAIIHSESSFNPRARSPVPAFGLMQLVPRSGARDAYLFVYKQDRMLSDTYLYDPVRNIELGVAYLHILDQRYFRRVEHPVNRMLCSIAGYNTGAGNVCKAFDAGTSLSRAAPVINGMTPEAVYRRLRDHLPYEETRHYLVKVYDRIALYREWQ